MPPRNSTRLNLFPRARHPRSGRHLMCEVFAYKEILAIKVVASPRSLNVKRPNIGPLANIYPFPTTCNLSSPRPSRLQIRSEVHWHRWRTIYLARLRTSAPGRSLTQAANHLLPLTHPNDNIYHHINSRRDTRASIEGSRTCRHKEELRHREEYKQDHGISRRLAIYQANSIIVSTNSPRLCRSARDRLKDPCCPSPPHDHCCDHDHNDHPEALGVFRVSAFTPQPWAV
jgi:hypothetical protein